MATAFFGLSFVCILVGMAGLGYAFLEGYREHVRLTTPGPLIYVPKGHSDLENFVRDCRALGSGYEHGVSVRWMKIRQKWMVSRDGDARVCVVNDEDLRQTVKAMWGGG